METLCLVRRPRHCHNRRKRNSKDKEKNTSTWVEKRRVGRSTGRKIPDTTTHRHRLGAMDEHPTPEREQQEGACPNCLSRCTHSPTGSVIRQQEIHVSRGPSGVRAPINNPRNASGHTHINPSGNTHRNPSGNTQRSISVQIHRSASGSTHGNTPMVGQREPERNAEGPESYRHQGQEHSMQVDQVYIHPHSAHHYRFPVVDHSTTCHGDGPTPYPDCYMAVVPESATVQDIEDGIAPRPSLVALVRLSATEELVPITAYRGIRDLHRATLQLEVWDGDDDAMN